jgi:arylsulfatase A-like enzyme
MMRYLIGAAALGLLCGYVGCVEAAERVSTPNIIVVLADDLGYNDVGAYGAPEIKTPAIDRLASRGIRFTDGYVAAAVCSPSRAGLMTGLFPARFGYDYNPSANYMRFEDAELGLPTDLTTVADMLKASGYATALIGKWHLGARDAYHPLERGFDEFFGIIGGGTGYFEAPGEDAVAWPNDAPTPRGTSYPQVLIEGREQVPAPGYLTDVFRDRAVDYIARQAQQKDAPFFLMLAPNAPHTPIEATRDYVARNEHIDARGARVYGAMVTALDDMVGAVVSELEQQGVADDTLIVFLSDNGCINYVGDTICSNAPLAGAKRYHLEGGVRVPFTMTWPAGLPSDVVYPEPISSVDLFATFAGAAGSARKTQDSVDLLPYLRGEAEGAPHEYLYWRAAPNASVRWGDWKLWRVNNSARDMAEAETRARLLPLDVYRAESPLGQTVVLYNLADDISERVDLGDEFPGIRDQLVRRLDAWEATLPPPLWPSRRSTLHMLHGQQVQLLF